MRNRPQSGKLSTKQDNRQPPNMDRASKSLSSIHPSAPPLKTLHYYAPLSIYWICLDQVFDFFHYTTVTTSPQTFSLNQARDLPSKYTFVPHPETAQLCYRPDPWLANKVNCTGSLSSDLSANNSFQPTARKLVTVKLEYSRPHRIYLL
jgi:hypothetical protein